MKRHRQSSARQRPARGMTLLICLFVIGLASMILVGMFNSSVGQLAALRNTADYERALYLAGAAVHESMAQLEEDASWRTGIASIELPPGSGNSLSASIADVDGGMVEITGVGVAGQVTRRLSATVETGG